MNNIQIFELTLKDYRQYEGENTVELESSVEKNINVIVGQNGAGKSNILNAITLCFYGEEAHIDSQSGGGLNVDPYITKRKLESLKPGESAEGYIEIKLGKDEPKYAFRRTFTTVRQDGSDTDDERRYTNSLGELTLRQRFGGNDWEPMPQPENVLHEILPTHVHQYFLFDGEQLDEFFEEGYSSRVRDAVHDVSHIELLDNAVNHLKSVQREFEKESANLGGDISDLQDRKERAVDELERLKKEESQLEEDIEEAKGNIEEINDKLKASRDEEVRQKQERREYLERKLEEKENRLIEIRAEVGDALAKAGGIALNADALSYAVDQLEEYEQQQTEIPGLNRELVETLIARGECLCGRGISNNSEAREHIENLHQSIDSNGQDRVGGRLQMEEAFLHGDELLTSLIEEDVSQLEEVRGWISDKETELARIESQLEDVETIDNEKAAELETQRQRISSRISEMNKELGEIQGKIKSQKETVEKRREEWRQAMEKKEQNMILVQKSVFTESAADTLSDIKDDILRQVRDQTQDRLEQYYNDLIWKDEEYNVELTEDYQVKLYNQDGRKRIGSLAAGERQVLALSFMAALSKISGFSAPIVIDTPLGRISSDPKRLIAQNVPNYLQDTQVTFLMTDVEYSEDVRAFIRDNVSNEYSLDYQSGVTEVKAND